MHTGVDGCLLSNIYIETVLTSFLDTFNHIQLTLTNLACLCIADLSNTKLPSLSHFLMLQLSFL